eukprot:Skav217717  [mRNA]  locus=scaffold2294:261067:262659:- [translate_table: standard]
MSVAVVASSGGGTATLGHTDAGELLRTIHEELLKVEGATGISTALFTSLRGGKGFDSACESDEAMLHAVKNSEGSADPSVDLVVSGALKDVNARCVELDQDLAKRISNSEIQGLICISCDVDIHAATLRAAAEKKIPVTGSGGTSLSAASSKFGIRLVGNAGGSVATTSYTRAVSYTYALASAWMKNYEGLSSKKQVPQLTSVLCACLPAFWAVVLACRALNVLPALPGPMALGLQRILFVLQTHALPTVCSVIMATSLAPEHGSTVLMSSALASAVCEKSILGGLLGGWLVAASATAVLHRCIRWKTPATMTNMIIAGGVGAAVALLLAPLISYLQLITETIRQAIHFSMSGRIPGVGFFIGALFCWGSKYGYYHAVCLPLILVEMERGQAALCGSIDEASLVCVSAGICLANLLVTPTLADQGREETVALSQRGLRINLLFGDFIEVAYPFMEKSTLVNMAGYLASGLSTEILAGSSKEVLSSAYLPLPVAIWLAEDPLRISLAYFAAFSISFLGATRLPSKEVPKHE